MNGLLELRALDQWVVWRTERRNGKPTKVPYRPDGRPAASNDPATWSPYEAVATVAARFSGVGFVFTPDDPFAGVDIDGALRDGQLHPDVVGILEQLDSYAEWSPSHNGVHVLLRAVKPAGGSSTKKTPWGDELAIYDRLRYFAITGDRLPSTTPSTPARSRTSPPRSRSRSTSRRSRSPTTAPASRPHVVDQLLDFSIRVSSPRGVRRPGPRRPGQRAQDDRGDAVRARRRGGPRRHRRRRRPERISFAVDRIAPDARSPRSPLREDRLAVTIHWPR